MLLAAIPLLILGGIYSFPRNLKKALDQGPTVLSVRTKFEHIRKRMRRRVICGYVWFIIFTNFLLLYLICFCHVASPAMSGKWARSAALCVILDLVILEMAAVILFALLGTTWAFCGNN